MASYKYLFSLIIGLSLIICACENNNKCSDFKTGDFILHSKYLNSDILINRKDSIQVEKIVSSGKVIINKIEWINSCEYKLQYLNVNFPISDSDLAYLRRQSINTRILKTEKDYYIAESLARGMSEPYIDTIKRVK